MHIFHGEQLQNLSRELYVYDVLQQGWQQELKGYELNAKHTLTHLSKNFIKNFRDARVLAEEIAPDSVMYALRLARWNCVDPIITPGDMLVDNGHLQDAGSMAARFPGIPLHQAAYIAATTALGGHTHGFDHDEFHELTVTHQPYAVREIGGLLLYSASLQAEEASFDLPEAFSNRLANLRTHFGMPEPPDIEIAVMRPES